MDATKITTIIPTYRRPQLLERAIRSVLAQTYRNFEIHVYDNASGDETEHLVRQLASSDPRVKYHCHVYNIGAFQNFSFGLARVETPFFNILSDDDVLLPQFFDSAMSAFAAQPNLMVFGGATLWFDVATETIRDVPALRVPEGLHEPPEGFFKVLENLYTDWMGMLFKSEIVRAVGGLDQGADDAIDGEFICRCVARYPLFVSHVPCAIYTLHGDATSARNWSLLRWWTSINYPIAKLEGESWIGPNERLRISRLKRQLLRRVFATSLTAALSESPERARDGLQILSEACAWSSVPLAAVRSSNIFTKPARLLLAGAQKIRRLLRSSARRSTYRTYDTIVGNVFKTTAESSSQKSFGSEKENNLCGRASSRQ